MAKVEGSLNIDGGVSIPSKNVVGSNNETVNLTTDDYFVRAIIPSGGGTKQYLLPGHEEGSNFSKNGQILIVSQGDTGDGGGTVQIVADSAGKIEQPGSSVNASTITMEGVNVNVTLYYDGDAGKWIVTSSTGGVSYS